MIPEMISGKYGKTIKMLCIPSVFRAYFAQKDGKIMKNKVIPVTIRGIMEHNGRERSFPRKKPVPRI